MKYSTARRLTIMFASIAAIFITSYFYLDAKDRMIPILPVIIKPVAVGTLLAACFILMANIMATRKNEDRITNQNFRGAFIVLICLIAFRVITHFV
ncbi:hypothetical protein AB1K89_13250 [Sporosarcina sp. 179-K 8C2 HS]|uniref:hypothetical protein n=1 Tax=Sporosarcina sp. 179-K 8C2 HS TaxID=3142387 RepID=UPI0039A222D1